MSMIRHQQRNCERVANGDGSRAKSRRNPGGEAERGLSLAQSGGSFQERELCPPFAVVPAIASQCCFLFPLFIYSFYSALSTDLAVGKR